MDKTQTVYKIRNSEGLFSPGRTNDSFYDANGKHNFIPIIFDETGKTWNKIGHAKAHIKNLKIVGSDWEIVEYEIIQKTTFKATDYKHKNAITTDELLIKEIIE